MVQISKLRIICTWISTMALDLTFTQPGRNPKLMLKGQERTPPHPNLPAHTHTVFLPQSVWKGKKGKAKPAQTTTNKGPLWMHGEAAESRRGPPSEKDLSSQGSSALGIGTIPCIHEIHFNEVISVTEKVGKFQNRVYFCFDPSAPPLSLPLTHGGPNHQRWHRKNLKASISTCLEIN